MSIALVLEVSGMLPIVDSQPTIFFLFFGSNIIASGIYFIDLLTSPDYLDINPLEQFSFWQATFILFYFSMIFLIQVAFNYLWANYPDLLTSLYHFPRILSILSSVTLVATLASYKLKWKSDKQLIYV
ncbi:hypothetical protein [Algoriphagus sp. CAU 1675]|uniref:hypothetical protein n=1 Tax=Algoriphagus sp. CAU 1675 TaxID=3032597 RepID=UPI0023DB198D|nr:hypothetical protein [Algoriphagus sp. CAU 1675]MDF2156617.1 hypothetical protein [Algoriphagus sp. CAU 1675]